MCVNKIFDIKVKRNYYIGVLDIVGFEIFDVSYFKRFVIFDLVLF